MEADIIDIKDHPHANCRAAKLEWFDGERAVYSVKAGFVAIVSFMRCVDRTFETKAAAMLAAREGAVR